MKRLVNGLVIVVTVTIGVVVAELAVRLIDGLPIASLIVPESRGALGRDTTASHVARLPTAAGISRKLYDSEPPPLPNRTEPRTEDVALFKKLHWDAAIAMARGVQHPFQPWDAFKVWNTAHVGDPCKHFYVKNAPGWLDVFDPPGGEYRPVFRFLPSTTAPDGLVTNEFGWRGPPVPFKRTLKTVRIVVVGGSVIAEIHHFPFSTPEYLHHWLNLWAAERKLDVRFEVLNAGREGAVSMDIAEIVRQEVVAMRPDLVVYYAGANQLDMKTVVKDVPPGEPRPAGMIARWLRAAAPYSALAQRAEALTSGEEWPKPDYKLEFPAGVDENDPDITRRDILPVNLPVILHDIDRIRGDLSAVGGELAMSSFHWLPKAGLVFDPIRHKPILHTLNIALYPYRYGDWERMTAFEGRVFAKYAKAHGLPFLDIARHMPHDPDLFSDAAHNTPAGVKLRAWIMLQELAPVIEARLASGAWPKPPPEMPDVHPAFIKPPRRITFSCKPS
jgi:hypothetical protein